MMNDYALVKKKNNITTNFTKNEATGACVTAPVLPCIPCGSRGRDFWKNEVELGRPSLPDAYNSRVRWKESSLK
ncbi:hypothetical protein NDU88_003381 [Pleurodeles waltl]|uniref:Uncharacterized protein n=1 Tax=Pleurodeles waltl TaxID=8319 RepID=A0AAV7RCQ0_PLEWA|nr:hypothetical protein NDU88_003381 [Pleurodeles waltl]